MEFRTVASGRQRQSSFPPEGFAIFGRVPDEVIQARLNGPLAI